MDCLSCYRPTRSRYGVCGRPSCKSAYQTRWARVHRGSTPRPRQYPCLFCGRPCFTSYKYCTRTAKCRSLRMTAYKRWCRQANRRVYRRMLVVNRQCTRRWRAKQHA